MYNPLTWKNDAGEIQTRATKPTLAKRLYLMERFFSAYTSCRMSLNQYAEYALFVREGLHSEAISYIRQCLPRYKEYYLRDCQRLNLLYGRLNEMVLQPDEPGETPTARAVTPNQFDRLLVVLIDNDVDADEAVIVAEAVCNVLDLEMPKESPQDGGQI